MQTNPVIWPSPQSHLSRMRPDKPILYFSPAELHVTAHRFITGFDGLVTYAVKANDRAEVLANLVAAGVTTFDVASPAEMQAVRAVCPTAALHYNNPVRSPDEVAEAVRFGVTSASVDCPDELEKLGLLPAGAVRVFQNICRHRGMILVDAPRKIEGAIRCPYHSWCYGTDGRLVSTPHVGGPGQNTTEGIDRDDLGLIEVRSHIWCGIVWIDLSGTAPAFDVSHADLLARWAEFEQPLHHGGPDSQFTLDVNCNWKLAVENYCESYHLPWVHPGLNSYSRLEDHYHIEAPDHHSGQGTLVYRQLTG